MSIILAAGKGTRMKSARPKVLHRVCGYPMVYHVIDAVKGCGIRENWVVIGYGGEVVKDEIGKLTDGVSWIEQKEQLGTGHAVRVALDGIEKRQELTLILYGDTPLLRSETLRNFVKGHIDAENDLSILTAELPDPTGYGRIVRDKDGKIVGIVEEKDATDEQRKINEINTGIYCVKTDWLEDAVGKLSDDNAQGEFYLTDIVSLIGGGGGKIGSFPVVDLAEIEGVNDRVDLARAQHIMENRILEELMKSGVTIYHPDSLYVEAGLEIGRDSIVYPNCSFVDSVKIGRECVIGSGSYFKRVSIGDYCNIGVGSYLENVEIPSKTTVPPFSVLRG